MTDVEQRAQDLIECDCQYAERLAVIVKVVPDHFIRHSTWCRSQTPNALMIRSLLAELGRVREENHGDCHDLVCSGSRKHPRGAKGVSCSCRGRDTAYANLRTLQEQVGKLERYAQHLADCPLALVRGGHAPLGRECTCGLAALLPRPSEKDEADSSETLRNA